MNLVSGAGYKQLVLAGPCLLLGKPFVFRWNIREIYKSRRGGRGKPGEFKNSTSPTQKLCINVCIKYCWKMHSITTKKIQIFLVIVRKKLSKTKEISIFCLKFLCDISDFVLFYKQFVQYILP